MLAAAAAGRLRGVEPAVAHWAHDQGIAWEGANRTLLYLVVFALLALWPLRPGQAGSWSGAGRSR